MTNRLIYASSEQCADLWYESGFSAPDDFLWYEIDGKAAIVVSALEVGRAVKQARPGIDVISFAEARKRWGIPADSRMDACDIVIALSHSHGVSRWSVPEGFPFGLAKKLLDAGLSLDVLSPFSPGRRVKTAREIALIREAIAMTAAGIRRAWEILGNAAIGGDGVLRWNGEPLLAETLGAEINIAIARLGGTASGTITAPGKQGADPHCQGFGPIHANEPIVMDVFPRCDKTGYFGDLTRTVVKGTAPDIVRRTYDTVHAAQKLAFGMLKPGIPGADVHNAVADYFTRQGFPTTKDTVPATGFFHGLGHSFGLEIHEAPGLSPRNSSPLVPGNVVTVEPGLYYPEWGGIRIEDDALITETGVEKLSDLPVFLEIQ